MHVASDDLVEGEGGVFDIIAVRIVAIIIVCALPAEPRVAIEVKNEEIVAEMVDEEVVWSHVAMDNGGGRLQIPP